MITSSSFEAGNSQLQLALQLAIANIASWAIIIAAQLPRAYAPS